MYTFRPILNTDPPRITEIWNSQPPQRGMVGQASPWLLERWVFSRPTFDPAGFIVATSGDQVVGFVHVGFGPSDEQDRVSTELGVTSMLMVFRELAETSLSEQLLAQGEAHLRARGAKVLYAGGIRPLNPFYLGVYGGSDLPGILESDAARLAFFKSHGYEEIDRVHILQRRLEGFRPKIDRTQMQLRRTMQVSLAYDPPSCNWWDACTTCGLDRTRFELSPRQGGPPIATATFWDMEPFTASWGIRSAGLIDLQVDQGSRRCGMASYLLGEALGRLREEGIELVEAQAMASNAPAGRLYTSLGLEQIDQGIVLRRSGG